MPQRNRRYKEEGKGNFELKNTVTKHNKKSLVDFTEKYNNEQTNKEIGSA